MRCLFIILSFFVTRGLLSQTPAGDSVALVSSDSLKRAKELHKKTYSVPRRVTVMSALLPGLGQVYNNHYWKVPVIYAGIGGFAWMFVANNREYNYYRNNLRAIYDDDSSTTNITGYSDENVQVQKVIYRKRRDLAGIGIAAVYLLNVIDANVSAHLKTFDVSDDLSLQVLPQQGIWPVSGGIAYSAGVTLKLNFK